MKKHPNEEWIIQQLKEGLRSRDIAEILHLSTYTISKYVSRALSNLSVFDLASLICNVDNPKQLLSPKTQAYKKIVEATPFVSDGAQIRERCWYIYNKTTQPPTCKCCNNHTKWDYTQQQFRTYCSKMCSDKDPELQQKRENTLFEKHGVKHPGEHQLFRAKQKETMKQKFGVEYPFQRHMSVETLETLNNKQLMKELISEFSTFEISDQLGTSQACISCYIRKHNLTSPKKSTSRYERELVDELTKLLRTKIVLNSRKIIAPSELDIFIPSKNVAIEFNGLFWHSELLGKDKNYHINKTRMCEEKNIRLIHIFEHQWLSNKRLILKRLKHILGNNVENRVYARKCEVRTISQNTSRKFTSKYHIQKHASASVHLGLFFKNKLVSVMTFGKSRYNKKYQWELIRFCSISSYSVVGGASKLFHHFVKTFIPESVITYSDKSWNTGNVYEKMGFTYLHTSAPNYFYFKNATEVFSRVKFQKHKLSKKLKSFDPSLTEWDNMRNNGYNKFWDCGNDVFVWNC